VIVLPIALMVLCLALEVGRCLETIQMASTLSREAASIGFRECAADRAPKTEYCLQQVSEIVQTYAQSVAAGAAVSVSVYAYDTANGTMARAVWNSDPAYPTRYAWNDSTIIGTSGAAPDLYPDLHTEQRVVVIGEAFIPFAPMLPGISHAFSITSGLYYHATVL
jgi:hypothetical protein